MRSTVPWQTKVTNLGLQYEALSSANPTLSLDQIAKTLHTSAASLCKFLEIYHNLHNPTISNSVTPNQAYHRINALNKTKKTTTKTEVTTIINSMFEEPK